MATHVPGELLEYPIVFNRPLDVQCYAQITIRSIDHVTPGTISDTLAARMVDVWYGGASLPPQKPGSVIDGIEFSCPLINIPDKYDLVKIQLRRTAPYDTTIPAEDFTYLDEHGNRLYKTTQQLVSEYPQYFSFTGNRGFVINDSLNPKPSELTEWADSITVRLDENPVLTVNNVTVIDLANLE